MSKVADMRDKWPEVQPNLVVGDVVLIRDKNLHRTQWSTGTVTEIILSGDGLVRSVVVKPHKRPDKTTTEAPRARAVVDLVLIKSILHDQREVSTNQPSNGGDSDNSGINGELPTNNNSVED